MLVGLLQTWRGRSNQDYRRALSTVASAGWEYIYIMRREGKGSVERLGCEEAGGGGYE
jgi:ribosomal protein L20